MNKTTEFCKKHGIKISLEKKWYEKVLKFLYTRRMKEYHQNLTFLQSNYERLKREVEKVTDYYNKYEFPKIASYTDERFDIEMPEIDFSNIETANCQIDDALRDFSNGKIWKEMFAITSQVLYNARKAYIYEAIEKIPHNKNVIVIKSAYSPKEELQENFKKQCIGLANNPSKCGISIKCVHSTEWFAFCPFKGTHKDIEYLISEWVGNPIESNVSYL